jgi:hypothetical protein
LNINSAGEVVGYYLDAHASSHGFLRFPDGTVTSFDPPMGDNTDAAGINDLGIITGSYSNGGYLRVP